jgi:hypothetical protein
MPSVKRLIKQRRLGYQTDAHGSVIAAITVEQVEYTDGSTGTQWMRYRIGPTLLQSQPFYTGGYIFTRSLAMRR